MFEPSVKRFVDDYHNINDQFRKFVLNVFLDVDSSSDRLKVIVTGKTICEMTRTEYLNLSAQLCDTIGQSSRRRHFALYHYLVSQGHKFN